MWVFPLAAAGIAGMFCALLLRQFAQRRRPYQAFWAIALLMYAAASFALFLGVLDGWNAPEFKVYWLFGAVLTVPFLAQGEVHLLVRSRAVAYSLLGLLVVATVFAAARVLSADVSQAVLADSLPRGKEVFAADPYAHRMAQYYAYPTYAFLLFATLWSAWRMRGRPELRDRFLGTLAIAIGATIVAAGSAFAAAGMVLGFSITLTAGIAVMFIGFLRASRHVPAGARGT